MQITVSIVEDDARVRASLAKVINQAPGFCCASIHASGESALEAIPRIKPEVILMDLNLPGISGIECTAHLKTLEPTMQIVMLTVYEDLEQIFKALRAGTTGYLLKQTPPEELLAALSEVHRGGSPMTGSIARKIVQSFHQTGGLNHPPGNLSPREQEVLQLLAKGYLYKEISEALDIKYASVHSHIRRIYEKLHVRSRGQAVAKYLQP